MEVTDPVRGVRFDMERATAMAEHDGWGHFFCWRACHRLFTADPERYVTIRVLATASAAQHRRQTGGGEDER